MILYKRPLSSSMMKVAVVQTHSVYGKVAENVDNILKISEEATAMGAKLICFPEMAVQGYHMPFGEKFLLNIESKELDPISELSKKSDVVIVAGMAEDDESGRYISMVFFKPDGSREVYRKSHLGDREALCFKEGDDLPVFDVFGMKVGVMICWESHFPEISTVYALKGADLILNPYASPVQHPRRAIIWKQTVFARAYDNSMCVAMCNQKGENGMGVTFSGGCMVLGRKGTVMAETGPEGDEILVFDVPDKMVENNHGTVVYLNHRRPELYDEIIRK